MWCFHEVCSGVACGVFMMCVFVFRCGTWCFHDVCLCVQVRHVVFSRLSERKC